MKTEELVKEVDACMAVMFPLLKMTGLAEKRFTRREIDKSVDLNELTEAVQWLYAVKENEFKIVQEAYERQPPHFWENVKILNIKNLPEIKLLNQSLKVLKDKFLYDAPGCLFRKNAGLNNYRGGKDVW